MRSAESSLRLGLLACLAATLCCIGCVTPPKTSADLDPVQITDADMTCDEIKDKIAELDALAGQNNAATGQTAATMAATQAATQLAMSGAMTTTAVTAIPIVGNVLSVASMVAATNQSNSYMTAQKVQVRKQYLTQLYVQRNCSTKHYHKKHARHRSDDD
jgi:hypothetical protein